MLACVAAVEQDETGKRVSFEDAATFLLPLCPVASKGSKIMAPMPRSQVQKQLPQEVLVLVEQYRRARLVSSSATMLPTSLPNSARNRKLSCWFGIGTSKMMALVVVRNRHVVTIPEAVRRQRLPLQRRLKS